MELVKDIYEANCITHSGTMHADDIFSTAFLDLYIGNVKVFRTTNIPLDIDKNVIVYDLGRGQFDHHQEDALKRDNGITYCGVNPSWNAVECNGNSMKILDLYNKVWNILPYSGNGFSRYKQMSCNSGYSTYYNR